MALSIKDQPVWTTADRHAMQRALALARAAAAVGETPIGAVITQGDQVLAEGRNTRETDQNPLGHAELQAIRQAADRLGSWRLEDCTLYVTLEPCMMCAGAIYQARLPRLVFGAADPKGGFVCSQGALLDDPSLNHRVAWSQGLLGAESSALLQGFFRRLRARNKAQKEAARNDGA